MSDVLGQLLPLAVAVSVSPVQVIAVILLLVGRRPLPTAFGFVAGFVLGVGVAVGALVAVAAAGDLTAGSDAGRAAGWARVILGALLLTGATRTFASRPGPGDTPALPSWMERLQGASVPRSVGLGLALGAANPKLVALGLAAAATIAVAELPAGQTVAMVLAYTAIAAVGVALPVVAAVAMGDRAQPALERWRDWLTAHHAIVVSVLFLVLGVVLVGQGLEAL